MKHPVILLIVLFLIPATVYSQSGNIKIGNYNVAFDEAFVSDPDGDGFNERTSYYLGGALVLTVYDNNKDGQSDLWFRYDGDLSLNLEVYDNNLDGAPDEFLTMDESEQVVNVEKTKEETLAAPSSSRNVYLVVVLLVVVALLLGMKLLKKRSA